MFNAGVSKESSFTPRSPLGGWGQEQTVQNLVPFTRRVFCVGVVWYCFVCVLMTVWSGERGKWLSIRVDILRLSCYNKRVVVMFFFFWSYCFFCEDNTMYNVGRYRGIY